MIIRLTILTCEGRADQLARTVDSLTRSDWPGQPAIYFDVTRHQDKRISQVTTARQILQDSERHEWDYLLFCEDDVLFNKFVYHNVTSWQPVKDGTLQVGTLYSSDDRPESHPHQIGGSQAVLIARSHYPRLIAHWEGYGYGPTVMQDMRIYQSSQTPIHVHQPNLVQHQCCPSTWGGQSHWSVTFHPDWRA